LLDEDYQRIADFRYRLRCFLRFSELAAKSVGLTPGQHQALLAIRGHLGKSAISVGELAERLQIRPHSAVELVDRMVANGLVERVEQRNDRRREHLSLTTRGETLLEELTLAHREELERMGYEL
jgi:DNA-binding MarR family transcriptional regulator